MLSQSFTNVCFYLATAWSLYPDSCFSDYYGRYLLYKKHILRSLNPRSLFIYRRRSVTALLVAKPSAAAKPLVAKPNGDCNGMISHERIQALDSVSTFLILFGEGFLCHPTSQQNSKSSNTLRWRFLFFIMETFLFLINCVLFSGLGYFLTF